ncbi:MAG: isoprenyl transferase [Thermodesulfobacteriota bacterium]
MPDQPRLDTPLVPAHVAIIMDGNGRWARQRGLPRLAGHSRGMAAVRTVVRAADELGVRVLTLYAFSTENWKRPALEVRGLMALLKAYLRKELAELHRNRVRLRTIGETANLPADVRAELERAMAVTAHNPGLVLNLALSYGGRNEIVRAARKLAARCLAGELTPEAIDEASLAAALDTAGLPDPDLLIRTGGEWRLSNFLLWQASYAEILVTDLAWPDFGREQLLAAVQHYAARERRFGRTSEQLLPAAGRGETAAAG